MKSQGTLSVLTTVTKLEVIKTPATNGKLKSASAIGEYPFASFKLLNSTESPEAINVCWLQTSL